jgi:rare lipoprotein A
MIEVLCTMKKLLFVIIGGLGFAVFAIKTKLFAGPVPSLLTGEGGLARGPIHEVGLASWYGGSYQGKPTASGELFDVNKMTAAHKKLKFGTKVQVTDTATGNSVVVRINDRGPFVTGRIIDLSQSAAAQLGIIEKGVANVEIRIV